MVILLVGASGLLGSALRRRLQDRGDEVRTLVRRPARQPYEMTWDPAAPLPGAAMDGVRAVINLGGTGVGDKRWTTQRLAEVLTSRTGPTHTVATGIATHATAPVRYLQANAVGYYGPDHGRTLDESSPAGDTTLANVCVAWQHAAEPAIAAGHEVTFLRSGIVLSTDGGAAAPLLRLLKLGLGGPMGNGRQWWSWIDIEDWVGVVVFLLDAPTALTGPVNLCAPGLATNAEITRALATALRRPSFLAVPGFALKIAIGGFAEELLQSQKVVPRVLVDAGYEFVHPDIAGSAAKLAGRPARD